MNARRAMGLAALLLLLATAAPPRARAHGRPPALGDLQARPGQPERLVARATWGLAISDDGGERWRWLCAAVMGVDARTEDPAIAVTADGAIVAATFGGLLRSDDGGCSWSRPAAALADVFVVDLWRVDGRGLLAVAAGADGEDRLFRSDDAGRSWRALGESFGEVLVDRVRSAPSAPRRVYASGSLPSRGGRDRRAFLLHSDDGGASFERAELPLEEGERAFDLWAVDPSDPDVLYGQVLHFDGEDAPERIVRSEDGGRTFETVLRIPYVGGLLVTEAGAVYAGSRLGGLWRAPDGRDFQRLASLPVTCLAEAGGALWACLDEARAGHALARSEDGRRFETVLRLAGIDAMVECPRCSPAGIECRAWAGDIAYDLGLDASPPPGFDPDGGTGGPRDAGRPEECRSEPAPGCGCRAGGRRGLAPGGLVILAALGVLAALAPRRRTPRAS
jgi:photosystem II stability/assembly factor-like uncharacterized protein